MDEIEWRCFRCRSFAIESERGLHIAHLRGMLLRKSSPFSSEDPPLAATTTRASPTHGSAGPPAIAGLNRQQAKLVNQIQASVEQTGRLVRDLLASLGGGNTPAAHPPRNGRS